MNTTNFCNRLTLSLIFIIVAASAALAQKDNASKIIFKDKSGKLITVPYNEKGDRMIDFSNVGYMEGGVALPDVPVVLTLSPLEDSANDSPRIQAAIDSVAKMRPDSKGIRGAVLLKKGKYVAATPIRINTGGVVLRGEGDAEDGTVIHDLIKKKNDFIVISGKGQLLKDESSKQEIIDEYVASGSKVLHVADGSAFKPGDKVCISRAGTVAWIHELGTDSISRLKPGVRNWNPETYSFDWERKVEKVNGNEITLNSPVVDPLNKKLSKSYLYKCSFDGRISQAGVENLRLVSYFDPSIKKQLTIELIKDGKNGIYPQNEYPESFADDNHGWAAVAMDRAEDCWVRNVSAVHFAYSCVYLYDYAKNITVQDCRYLDPVSTLVGGHRYSFCINGQLNLVQRCYSKDGRHDFVLQSYTRGPNVFFDCIGDNTWAMTEAHHRWSQGCLWDNVNTIGPWNWMQAINRSSSGSGHGWTGLNFVFWNCDAKFFFIQKPPTGQNFAIGRDHYRDYNYLKSPDEDFRLTLEWVEFHALKKFSFEKGQIMVGDGHIELPNTIADPRSLYLQQLKDRLGMDAVRNIATKQQIEKYLK